VVKKEFSSTVSGYFTVYILGAIHIRHVLFLTEDLKFEGFKSRTFFNT